MRSVEEIQNLVFSAFENMLMRPEVYMPCTPEEFEARLSSYLWVLAVSVEGESDWAKELELIRQRQGWAEPLDLLASLKLELSKKGPAAVQEDGAVETLIAKVVEFYGEMAERLGFVPNED